MLGLSAVKNDQEYLVGNFRVKIEGIDEEATRVVDADNEGQEKKSKAMNDATEALKVVLALFTTEKEVDVDETATDFDDMTAAEK